MFTASGESLRRAWSLSSLECVRLRAFRFSELIHLQAPIEPRVRKSLSSAQLFGLREVTGRAPWSHSATFRH
ncbi:hypothetical protein EVAR_103525_1 [Eumeta japonica]|uniref:Uncharacterized protein n=1 Tax=Eumeta variegata TaxID=151549 RepID=A0A4C1YWR6_EUMVA|nr:hypothetical protein EVAR_103525_1 [Eumeta japonica]